MRRSAFLMMFALLGCAGDESPDSDDSPASGDLLDVIDMDHGLVPDTGPLPDVPDPPDFASVGTDGGSAVEKCAPFEGGEASFQSVASADEPGPHHALSCGRVVWATPKGGLKVYESIDGRTIDLIEDSSSPDGPLVRWPDIHAEDIVFAQGDPPQVYLLKLGGVPEPLAPSENAQLRPRISALQIAWEEEVDGVAQIRAHDRVSALTDFVDPTAADQRFVSVSDAQLTWTDFRNDDNKVWDADGGDETDIHGVLESGSPMVISAAKHKQAFSDIDQGLIVWLDWRNVAHDENGYPQPEPKLKQSYEIWIGTVGPDGNIEEAFFQAGGQGSYSGLPRLDGTWVAWAENGVVFGAHTDSNAALVNLSVGSPASTAPVIAGDRLLFMSAIGLKLVTLSESN